MADEVIETITIIASESEDTEFQRESLALYESLEEKLSLRDIRSGIGYEYEKGGRKKWPGVKVGNKVILIGDEVDIRHQGLKPTSEQAPLNFSQLGPCLIGLGFSVHVGVHLNDEGELRVGDSIQDGEVCLMSAVAISEKFPSVTLRLLGTLPVSSKGTSEKDTKIDWGTAYITSVEALPFSVSSMTPVLREIPQAI